MARSATALLGRLMKRSDLFEDEILAIHELTPLEAVELGFFESLAQAAAKAEYDKPERRLATRYPLNVVAMATPLNDQFQPTDAPFPVLTRDISTSGIGLVHSRPLDMKYINLDLTGPNRHDLHLTVKVLRCNRLLCGEAKAPGIETDDACTYYESGGLFVSPNQV